LGDFSGSYASILFCNYKCKNNLILSVIDCAIYGLICEKGREVNKQMPYSETLLVDMGNNCDMQPDRETLKGMAIKF
jgi:hypothetical protein